MLSKEYNVLSIDVGIARLAFCLFSKKQEENLFHISKWSIVNLTKTSDTKITCCSCQNIAKFEHSGIQYCLKHSKTINKLLPSSDFKSSNINKLKLSDLFSLADKYSIPYKKEPSLKKGEITNIINHYIKENVFLQIDKTNASDLDLNTIGRNIKQNFDTIFKDDILNINEVVIENQLSPRAIRMKTIQGMISQYFIMKNDNIKIKFVNASNKLKGTSLIKDSTSDTSGKEMDYKDRKDLGIMTCKEIINSDVKYKNTTWSSFFNSQKKKDGQADLADCFLQGLWYIDKQNK
jgi:hypothetical protein